MVQLGLSLANVCILKVFLSSLVLVTLTIQTMKSR